MCNPSPPPAPDYAAAAEQQGEENLQAGLASWRMNNPNVITPYGTQTWSGYKFGDDGEVLSRGTLTQKLSPQQRVLYEKNLKTQKILANLGIAGAQSLKGIVGKRLDISGAPEVGDYENVRNTVMGGMMGRANEDYSKQTDQANSEMIAAGIRPGTKAYQDRMQMIERSRNDARSQAEVNAGNAASQAFGMDTQRRKDSIAEILTQRQTPLNEINALMSGSQVSNPFSAPGIAQNSNIQPSPIFGAAQAQGQADMNTYNAQQAGSGNMMSGLFGLGGAAIRNPGGLSAIGSMF